MYMITTEKICTFNSKKFNLNQIFFFILACDSKINVKIYFLNQKNFVLNSNKYFLI